MYVTVAENGNLGVFVGMGVFDGVISESGVLEGSIVNVGTSVAVSVPTKIVGVHVAGRGIGVIVGVAVGGGPDGPGGSGFNADVGNAKINPI
jgi:hypothetical protein